MKTTYCGGGTGIDIRRPLYHFEESPVHETITVDFAKKQDVIKVVVEQEQQFTGLPARQILFNTPCYYFFNTKRGCTRADCHFLHDEYISPSYKTRPPAGQLVDAKLYVQGIPPLMKKSDLMNIVEPYGYIKQTVLLPSLLASGRKAAIIHMTSEAQADAAVQALNAHVDYTGEKLNAEKQSVVPIGPRPVTAPPPSVCIPVHKNPWEGLEVAQDDDVEGKTNPFAAQHYPRLSPTKLSNFDQGSWKNRARTRAMMDKLA